MSLRQQFSLLTSFLVIVLFIGSLLLTISNARHAFEEQLNARAYDASSALSLALSQVSDDDTLQLRLIDALYDRGFFASIEFQKVNGQSLYKRNRDVLEAEKAPVWLASFLPIAALPAQTDVMQGWQRIGTVTVSSYTGIAYQELWTLIRTELMWYGLVLVLSLLLVQWLLRWLLRPLQEVEKQAKAITERQWPIQEHIPRTRELKHMVLAMNQMVQRLRSLFSEQAALTEKLRLETFTDSPTGLLNRRGFDQRLDTVLKDVQEHSGVLLLLQLHNLAAFNQEQGRQAADDVIATLARQLQLWTTGLHQAFVGRRSGADFAVYLPCVGRAQAMNYVQALIDELATSVLSARNHLDFHIGAVFLQQEGDALSSALSRADAALRQAQQQGSASFVLYQDDHGSKEPTASEWRALLLNVLHYEALQLLFHTSFDQHGQPVQVEVLSRITLDEHIISAGRFWPMVEQHHLSAQFDALIIRKVLHYLTEVELPQNLLCCVNLSAASVLDQTLLRQLVQWLESAPEAAKRLAFEVPEAALSSIEPGLQPFLDAVRPFGVRFGVDQVGTGSVAFAYLRRLPIAYLRIDGSFSRNLAQAQDQRFFVQSMVQIANNLDMDVLADGVEQEADAKELWQAHVQALSGYYYGRPSPTPRLQQH